MFSALNKKYLINVIETRIKIFSIKNKSYHALVVDEVEVLPCLVVELTLEVGQVSRVLFSLQTYHLWDDDDV